ncbi:hypothetical protein SVIOM74S_02581 [Streptomyces violarus]
METGVHPALAAVGSSGDHRVATSGAVGSGRLRVGQRVCSLTRERQAGQDRPGVHVHEVLDPQQPVQLTQRQPVEVLVQRDLVEHLDDHVAVALAVEPGALFGLEHIGDHLPFGGVAEVLQVRDGLAAVHPRVVAAGGLDRRGELESAGVARLELGLDEAVQDPVALLHQEAEDAHLGLVHDRLGPAWHGGARDVHVQSLDAENLPGVMGDVPRPGGGSTP